LLTRQHLTGYSRFHFPLFSSGVAVKFTPLDIRHAEFNGQVSGYAKRGVREFLAQVADDAEEYERQIRALQERVTTLEAQVTDLRQGEESLRRAVVSAERIGNEVKASADREAQLMIREAEGAKEKLLREALQKARDIRVEIEKARGDKQLFLNQFRALLQGYMESIDRADERTPGG
jgi:cell division initiation protein